MNVSNLPEPLRSILSTGDGAAEAETPDSAGLDLLGASEPMDPDPMPPDAGSWLPGAWKKPTIVAAAVVGLYLLGRRLW